MATSKSGEPRKMPTPRLHTVKPRQRNSSAHSNPTIAPPTATRTNVLTSGASFAVALGTFCKRAFARWRMGWPMAGRAADLIGSQIRGHCSVHSLPRKLRRPGMAKQAVGVWIGASVPDGLLPRARHIAPPVPDTTKLGLQCAMHAIGSMTCVALVRRNPFVPVMPGCQRGAIGIPQVADKRVHHMTRGTRANGFGLLKKRGCRADERNERKHQQPQQQHPVIGAALQAVTEQELGTEQPDQGDQSGTNPQTTHQPLSRHPLLCALGLYRMGFEQEHQEEEVAKDPACS